MVSLLQGNNFKAGCTQMNTHLQGVQAMVSYEMRKNLIYKELEVSYAQKISSDYITHWVGSLTKSLYFDKVYDEAMTKFSMLYMYMYNNNRLP